MPGHIGCIGPTEKDSQLLDSLLHVVAIVDVYFQAGNSGSVPKVVRRDAGHASIGQRGFRSL